MLAWTHRASAALVVLLAFGLAACGKGFGDGEDSSRKKLPSASEVQLVALGSSLSSKMATMDNDDTAEVIVSFRSKGRLSAAQIQSLEDMGLKGVYFNYLPIAGVVATKPQINALLQRGSEIVSLWHNDRLVYDNADARNMSSVDQSEAAPELRNANGEVITGKGVGILVNDSGIDGLHPDLIGNVVLNAYGHTDLRGVLEDGMFPFTPTVCPDGVPCNTDVGGSHGTHVAGIAAGDGSASGGKHAGAARGASLIGFGSGATLLVLNTLGGFDYALQTVDQRPELNLRIVTNSFGSPGDQGTPFDPANPTNIATKALADAGIIVVFSAGNSGSGPGSITGNFKKAPWILIAGNGEKTGLLAPSSSRGKLAGGVYEMEIDGETYTIEDRPTVVTAGTGIVSARAVAADPFTPLDTADDAAAGDLGPTELPFYTHKTGTSMSAPHLAGLVALLLEANPSLTWREVKNIFKTTASNMPGYEPWEVGAGFANIEAAIAMALNIRQDYGSVNHLARDFNAKISLSDQPIESQHSIDFLPAGPTNDVEFEVAEDIGLIIAVWNRPDESACTCAVSLIDPDGTRYGSGIALPVLAPRVSAVANGKPGKWKLAVRGIGGVSGVDVDPANVTNGYSGPATVDISLTLYPRGEERGFGDVLNHADLNLFKTVVTERLMDGLPQGFAPDAVLTRGQMAEYLMAWGVRQTRAHVGASSKFGDISDTRLQAAAEAVTRPGASVLSRDTAYEPLILVNGSAFNPSGAVTREELAYALVQASGAGTAAKSHSGEMSATDSEGRSAPVQDADQVNSAYLGYVQEALQRGILKASFSEESGELKASVSPKASVTRAEYAAAVAQAFAGLPFP